MHTLLNIPGTLSLLASHVPGQPHRAANERQPPINPNPQTLLLPVQAADLISRIAPVMKKCDEEKLLAHLGVVLYENLGEEYPGALGCLI